MERRKISTSNMVKVALFVALITVGAYIKIPIPNMVFTLQFMFVNLAGLLLGPVYGAMSVAIYVLLGLMGVPVFTAPGGPGYVFHPTFGYLIGFIIGAWLAGYIVERKPNPTLKRYFFATFVDLVVVYALGVIYYYYIVNYYLNNAMPFKTVFFYCFVVLVPSDIILGGISAVIAKRVREATKHYR